MLVFEPKAEINKWIASKGGGLAWPESYTAMGWVENGALVGGICFYDHLPGRNVMMGIALEGNRFPIGLFKAWMHYAFSQLRLPRLTFLIADDNLPSIELVQRLGANLEASLTGCSARGNLLIFCLRPEFCRYWSKDGQGIKRPDAAGLQGADGSTSPDQPGCVQLPTERAEGEQLHPVGLDDVGKNPGARNQFPCADFPESLDGDGVAASPLVTADGC